jgi:hypothetical protein
MTFLAPWAVWFLAGVPLIVLLYLLKLKRRPLPVSTLMFWQRVLEENRRRALFQKLRNLLSLLLHLLIFALILAALAKPVLDRAMREGASTVLIVDTRARMQAGEAGGGTRLELAKKLAANYLSQAAAGRQVAILSAQAAPTVAAPFTSDEKILREALNALAPTDTTGDLHASIDLAEQLLAARQGAGRIVVLTAPGAESSVRDRRPNVEWVPVGTGHDNLAITRFATRPLLNSPQTSEVLLEVVNFGAEPATLNLELSLDGRLLDVKPLTLAAGAREVQVFPTVPRTTSGGRGWLTARLDAADALLSDNVAYAVLPPQQFKRVLLVTKGNWFLEKLLEADQGVKFELLTPDAFQLAFGEKFDAVILDDFLPRGFDLAQIAGNFLCIKQTPFAAGGAPLEQPLIAETDAGHPALRLVNLQNVTVVRASALVEPPRDGDWRFETPIRSIAHPLMITGERRAGKTQQRIAALALDLTDSDLPLRVAFPLLMSNTLQWLAGEPPPGAPVLAAGATLPLTGDQSVWIEPQTKWTNSLNIDPTRFAHVLFQPSRNGYYLLNQREGTRWLAVNTFSEAESDLRAPRDIATAARLPILPALSLSGWPLWHYLALAALLLFTLEWWLFHRRRTE